MGYPLLNAEYTAANHAAMFAELQTFVVKARFASVRIWSQYKHQDGIDFWLSTKPASMQTLKNGAREMPVAVALNEIARLYEQAKVGQAEFAVFEYGSTGRLAKFVVGTSR
jgi:hypothetical protein